MLLLNIFHQTAYRAECELGHLLIEIQVWKNHIVFHAQQGDDGLHGAGSAGGVPGIGLRGTYQGQFRGKEPLDGAAF